jgi:flagellar basal-body rod modification protein FlgD
MTNPISGVSPAQSAAAATGSTASTNAAAATNSLNYDDFLTLLITELKHQDPTQPMDPTQMVTQLATVSQVGQSVVTNQHLTSLLNTSALTQAENLIGRTVISADGFTKGVVQSVSVSSTGATATLDSGATVPLSSGATIQ